MSETEQIKKLMKDGYVVVVKNPDAVTFDKKYHVYQGLDAPRKAVIVDKNGKPVALQG